jgi:hypothetical protein
MNSVRGQRLPQAANLQFINGELTFKEFIEKKVKKD